MIRMFGRGAAPTEADTSSTVPETHRAVLRARRFMECTSQCHTRGRGPVNVEFDRSSNGLVTAVARLTERAHSRAQQAPKKLALPILLRLRRFPTLLRPRTGAHRQS